MVSAHRSGWEAKVDDAAFVRRFLLAVAMLAILAAAWLLTDLLLVLFASVLIAVLLRAIADPIAKRLGVADGVGILLAVALFAAIFGAALYLFGSQVAEQLARLSGRLEPSLTRLVEDLRLGSWAEMLKNAGSSSHIGNLVARVFSWTTNLIGALAALLIAVIGGIYLAAAPADYRGGFLKLVPPSIRPEIARTLDDCAEALRRWLGAQLLAMVIVGLLTTLGLLLIGVPSALALGLIAGLAELIPYVGPMAAAIPALLIVGSLGWEMTLWTLGLYVVIQIVENNLLVPILASRSVSIPPVLAVFAILAMGILFGPLGLLLGFPLSVVLVVAVKRLYVRDTLGERVDVLGQPGKPTGAGVARPVPPPQP